MRIAIALLTLCLPACASVFDAPPRTQALDAGLKHVEMTRVDRLDAVMYVGAPLDVAWLCGQVGARTRIGAASSASGCQFDTLRDGLRDPVIIVSRDDRTGGPDPVVMAHELCHVKGGNEQDC